jgi:hypothetical protein
LHALWLRRRAPPRRRRRDLDRAIIGGVHAPLRWPRRPLSGDRHRDEIANGKPAPDIYLEAARRLGVPPSQCVALEDSDAGILSASRARMTALMVPDLKPPSAAASEAAFRVLRTLDDAASVIAALLDGRHG